MQVPAGFVCACKCVIRQAADQGIVGSSPVDSVGEELGDYLGGALECDGVVCGLCLGHRAVWPVSRLCEQ